MNYEAEKTELKRLFDYYFMLASKGVAWAQTWIADAYFWGWGVDMDYSSFIEWDTRAARNGAPISKKRMVLYYLSKGNINAAISACRIRDERIFISTHSNEYPTEVKFARFSEYSSSRFHSYLLNPENQLINKSIEQIISDFEVYLNNDMQSDETSLYGFGEVDLSRAICQIFGFGLKQDFASAIQHLNKIYESLNDLNCREYYYGDYDAWHYYCCIKEIRTNDIPINEQITNIIYSLPHTGYNTLAAYYYRHEIRKAFEGNIDSGARVGEALMEKEGKVENKDRLQIYHNDINALSYLKMAAGVIPNSTATIDVIDLTSSPEKKTFNWSYAYNLCINLEEKVDGIQDTDEYTPGISKKMHLVFSLKNAFENLARTTSDEMIRRNLNKKAQLMADKMKQT